MNKLMKMTVMAFSGFMMLSIASCGGNASESNGSTATDSVSENVDLMKALETEVNTINKQLPLDMGNGIKLAKMEVSDGYLVTTCTYPEDGEVKIEDTPEARASILSSLNPSSVSRVKSLNLGIRYIYKQDGTDKETVITFKSSEL